MRRLHYAIGLCALVSGVAPASAAAQLRKAPPPLPQVVLRLALDDSITNSPIAGATVEVLSRGLSARSNDHGDVQFKDVPVGFQRIRIRAVGYRPFDAFIKVPEAYADDNTSTLVDLAPNVEALPTVRVTSFRLRQDPDGFEARQRARLGHFILDTTFQREFNSPPSDVIASHAPGVVSFATSEGRHVLITAAGKGVIGGPGFGPGILRCPFDIYLNGVHQSDNFSIDDLQSFDISAVEVYTSGSIPSQFSRTTNDGSSGRQDCGVIVVWTKR